MKKLFIYLFLLFPTPLLAYEGFWDMALSRPYETIEAPTALDVFFPLYIWHNGYMYDDPERYNANPFGTGLGVSLSREGISSGLMMQVFYDSRSRWQAVPAYTLLKEWVWDYGFVLRLGGALTFQIRADYYYLPAPLPLPLIEIGHKYAALEASYVPFTRGNGNVLFVVLKISIPFK